WSSPWRSGDGNTTVNGSLFDSVNVWKTQTPFASDLAPLGTVQTICVLVQDVMLATMCPPAPLLNRTSPLPCVSPNPAPDRVTLSPTLARFGLAVVSASGSGVPVTSISSMAKPTL